MQFRNLFDWVGIILLSALIARCAAPTTQVIHESLTQFPEQPSVAAPTEAARQATDQPPPVRPTQAPTLSPEQLSPVSPTIAPSQEGTGIEADPSGQVITFWHAMSYGEYLAGMTALVNEFNYANRYGIKVQAVPKGGQSELERAVIRALATGELPNVTMGFADSIVRWQALDLIAALNEFINDPVYGLSEAEYAAISPELLSLGKMRDGTQLGMPMHQSAQVIFYNHTWAQELGFSDPPTTSAEFKEQACAASAANNADGDPDNNGTGGYVYYPDASMISPWIWAFGGEYANDSGDGYSLNNQAVIDLALFFKDLFDSGCTLFTPSYPNPQFAARQAMFATSSIAGIPFQRAAMEAAGNADVWGAIPFPGPDGTLAVDVYGPMIGIAKATPEEELASWVFLRYLSSPQAQAAWSAYTGYFPLQTITEVDSQLGDDPVWAGVLALLPLGKTEPNFPAHSAVRDVMREAFFAILEAPDKAAVIKILNDLNDHAAELVAERQ